MRRSSLLPTVLTALTLALATSASADDWDGEDDAYDKGLHDLIHGSEEWHDLGRRPGPLADRDHSLVPQDPYTSWEVIVDGVTQVTGEVSLDLMDAGGTLVVQSAIPPSTAGGLSKTLWWMNGAPVGVLNVVRVAGADCTSACTTRALYRIRAYETTISVPRFNNTGSQITTLLIQNTRSIARSATVYYWSAAGTLLGSSSLALPAHGLLVVNTGLIVPANSGSITIAHDAGYGGLAAKAVGVEPATGFSFDTPGTYKPK